MVDVSVTIPCLNEEAGIGPCITKITQVFERHRLDGEIVVCDNGSTDASAQIASALGALVVHQPQRGYGLAYRTAFDAASGSVIIMGDADNSYDFEEIPRLLEALDDADFVVGNRQIQPGAMPWLHRYVGNPLFSWLMRHVFQLHISDSHCGFGAIRRDALDRLHLESPGMEFASEILIKARKHGLRITEIPITYWPRQGKSKLRPFADGLRHLRLMLKELLSHNSY